MAVDTESMTTFHSWTHGALMLELEAHAARLALEIATGRAGAAEVIALVVAYSERAAAIEREGDAA